MYIDGYNLRCHCLKERALSEYKAQSWAKVVTPSPKLHYVRPFPGLLSSYYPFVESEIPEGASRKVPTEEPNKGL